MDYLEKFHMAKAGMDYMHFWRQAEFKRRCGNLKLSANRYEARKWGYGLLNEKYRGRLSVDFNDSETHYELA